VLEGSVVWQRGYESDSMRHGFFEQLMMARRYLMILFMFLSAFGLSFLRSYTEIMIPLSILLLGVGALVVVQSAKRERHEQNAKELEKAKEAIRNEVRRILSDVQRGWSSAVSQYLSDQQQSLLAQIEPLLREHQTRRTSENSEEKMKMQRQSQGLENIERKLTAVAKGRDMLASSLSQLQGEIRQLVLGAVKQQRTTA
jgi:hypothetical protein